VAKSLFELCSRFLWKAELAINEIGYIAEEIFKQGVKGVACFLLTSYYKMLEERDKLKKDLLSKK
jgi:hypothetical protein